MLTNCWIKHDLQRPNISSSFLDVSSPHLFGMSRVLRVPVQNRAGNIKRAVTSVLPCQPGVITGLTMIGSVFSGVFSGAARVGRDWLSLERRSSRAGGWGGVGDVCCCLSVCCEPLLLCAIFMSSWTVSTPVSRAKLTSTGRGRCAADSCLEILLQRRRSTVLTALSPNCLLWF